MAPLPERSRQPEARESTEKVPPPWLAPRFAPDPPEYSYTIQTDLGIRSSSSREVSLKVSRTSPVVGLIDSMLIGFSPRSVPAPRTRRRQDPSRLRRHRPTSRASRRWPRSRTQWPYRLGRRRLQTGDTLGSPHPLPETSSVSRRLAADPPRPTASRQNRAVRAERSHPRGSGRPRRPLAPPLLAFTSPGPSGPAPSRASRPARPT